MSAEVGPVGRVRWVDPIAGLASCLLRRICRRSDGTTQKCRWIFMIFS